MHEPQVIECQPRVANLDTALAEAMERYRSRNPNSERQFLAAAAAMPAGNTRTVLFHAPFPLTMVRGEDCHLWDADGHRYLNVVGEFTAGLYGHSDPAIRQAISEALAEGLSLSSHNAREAALAHEIRRRFSRLELLRFTNSGTEANLMALAAAVAHTGRRKVLVFDGAYHGGVLSFAGGGSAANVPHDWVLSRYNDLADAREKIQAHAGQFAAILVEPMLGACGCIPGEPVFLHGLRALADEAGALLVLDEVMTSRLSAGGRQAQLGLVPDITTLGKYFGGGLSFGAFGGRAEIMSRFDPRRTDALAHAGTFNNNTLTMAAGLAGLTQVLSAAALDALNQRGDRLRGRLNDLFAQHGVALQVTGLGSLMQLHPLSGALRCAEDLASADDRVKALLFFDLLERGIFVARRGLMALSLPVGDDQAAELVSGFDAAIARYGDLLPRRAAACCVGRPGP